MAITIVVVLALAPRTVQECTLTLQAGTTAHQVLRHNAIASWLSVAQLDSLEIAVWGKKVPASYQLHADDRLEVLRPLLVDPKVARRERFAHQGAKKAGLFKTRRTGAKAGY